MIQSMTGYGRTSFMLAEKTITIEIKTLNSKQLETNCRISPLFRIKELEIRNKIASLLRGKIDFYMYEESKGSSTSVSVNKNAILSYYHILSEVADELHAEKSSLLSAILRFPDVMGSNNEEFTEDQWQLIFQKIQETIQEVQRFRISEGNTTAEDLLLRINLIHNCLTELHVFEKKRIDLIKIKLHKHLSELEGIPIDQIRFEQEIIYYLEKLDITEENVRLQKHLDYFLDTIRNEVSQGKKLGFIAQEIGREINTIGSKSNHAEMQKKVVEMKDELEKIKEQLGNIL